MQITMSSAAGLQVAKLEGRLDTATAPQAETTLLPAIAAPGLVLDLTAVRYVSSAGLRLLLKLAKEAKGKGAKFALAGLQPAVREVFEISGFDKIIPAFATLDEATAG
ncbi:anti-sigma factor antagonist [Rhodovarius crocodyli]|uniref:Anti-sigma factor antagonist n=1 Tax=Rhodovarius crocodyli TaxID=1979269 RepID=A0A437MNL4_9PROT|nr:STAS domain-containing protein [Rhodovarius crocodyli]RVT99241.1 anti-sigma factor antagonist [Rhodovarius crocodyli]